MWTMSDHLLVAGGDQTGILQVPITGGELKEISPLDEENEVDIHEISLLPNGKDLVYVVHRRDPTGEQRLVDSLGTFAEGARKEVFRLEGASLISVVYSPPGYLLFHQTSPTPGVWALAFSADRLEATGEPVLVATDSWLPSASDDGTLALTQGLIELSPRSSKSIEMASYCARLLEPRAKWRAPISLPMDPVLRSLHRNRVTGTYGYTISSRVLGAD